MTDEQGGDAKVPVSYTHLDVYKRQVSRSSRRSRPSLREPDGMSRIDWRVLVGHYGTALAGLALILFFLLFAPNFASTTNIINCLLYTSRCV